MNRVQFFDRHRPLYENGRIPAEHVKVIDAIADDLGMPRTEVPTMKPSANALSLIREFEGCRLTAYPDPGSGGDPWTIGWGSTGPDIRRGVVWTQEQADRRLREHVAEFGEGVAKLLGAAPTTQNQFDALVSFAYNLGLGSLKESTLLRRHKEGSYAGAALEFGRWNKASGKVMPGLTRRRAAEAKLYRGEK